MSGPVKVAIVLLLVSAPCLILPPLTHSGLGSCGFFGPASFLLIPGVLLFVVACGLLLLALCNLLLRTASDFFNRQTGVSSEF